MKVDYSIIVPAYNEEALLENTLNQLKEAMAKVPLNGEIVVTDNNSTDRTAEIANRAGATVIFEPINQISRARNTGVRQAMGRYLIFVDADTIIPPAVLQTALNNLESGRCCGGGATMKADVPIPLAATWVLEYWNMISRTFRLAAGCFIYCRRDDFETCGGFSEKVYATEEIWFSRNLKRIAKQHQRQFCIITEPRVITSDRKLVWHSQTRQALLFIMLSLFPFIVRYKGLCGFWYKRPDNKKSKIK